MHIEPGQCWILIFKKNEDFRILIFSELQRLLLENERRMSDMNKTWEQRLEEAK